MNEHGTKTKENPDQREEEQAGKKYLWSLWIDMLNLFLIFWAMISIISGDGQQIYTKINKKFQWTGKKLPRG